MTPQHLTKLQQVEEITEEERLSLNKVTERFAFRSNRYYQSLINWTDPDDPIRRLVIPHQDELIEWGSLDASGEAIYTKRPGLEHKYPDRALLLVNNICGAFCSFCFRKRLFLKGNQETVRDVSKELEYVNAHPEISNILLTGGDPLLMSTRRLRTILEMLSEISHIRIVRIGSKMTAFNPYRILDDPELVDLCEKTVRNGLQLYLMNHFNHPKELTPEAVNALKIMSKTGMTMINQTPIIKGINDDPSVLSDLFNRLSYLGIPSYYVFQCRPTEGNFIYTLPLEEAYQKFIEAWKRSNGLARRARFVMSHQSGKIEVTGLTKDYILFRYHRASDSAMEGRSIICHRNPDGYWFDDFKIVGGLRDHVEDCLPVFPKEVLY